MSKVLVVLAHPHTDVRSLSMEVYEKFIEEYRLQHPDDDIIIRDLFAQPFPAMDNTTFMAIAKQHVGMELSKQEDQLLSTRTAWLNEFIEADKYIFVNPMYNHFLPVELKEYIDITAVARKTFRYTPEGAVGLLHNKKAIQIRATGGTYHNDVPHGEFEKNFGAPYLEMMLNYYGIHDVEHIYVEGAARHRDQTEEIVNQALKEASVAAKKF